MLLNTCLDCALAWPGRKELRVSGLVGLFLICVSAMLGFSCCAYAQTNDNIGQDSDSAPLEFSFSLQAPGEKVEIDNFSLHISCLGSGDTTVLFEAGLGGSSLEWVPIQEKVALHARACIYDRAGYAWSDPSPNPSDANTLSHEADIMLDRIAANGQLILVGHSFGGFVVRGLAMRRAAKMLGMVLVDASHEDQLERLEKLEGRSMMPRGNSFVVSPPIVPQSLPEELRRKVQAFSRMRKTYAALHSEMKYFRESAAQVKQNRAPVDYPIVVVSRGQDLYSADAQGVEKTAIWDELQSDLTKLSSQSTHIIDAQSGHHVHTDNPELIVRVINDMLAAQREQNSDEGSDQ
jgi:pimeloyl-ACP methyl ester carboxylesterase